ncbi:fibrinogen silencer-binding protein isoform X2 [Alosa sapidissima]|uniref:fibrinogen silencer-binding protein isoform X2 n=1 Tax=Alosa sapidissima TaxID=34773 RepID=UPI001C08D76A|nr:fibrinogen silencer-binding protein isoform X2 [Alosa sapidissima]
MFRPPPSPPPPPPALMIDPPGEPKPPLMRAPVLFPAMSNRTPNFTLEQKLYLLQRMQGVVETVQDFRKDTNTTAQRNAVWEQLARAFNAAFPDRPPSSTGSLKTLWKRLKVECRAALHRRQEQLAAGLNPTALTQVQREVTALVPNLISNKDDLDGDMGYSTNKGTSPVTGTSGSDQEEVDHNEDQDSKEQLAINLGLATPSDQKLESSGLSPDHAPNQHLRPRPQASSDSTPRPPALFYPSQAPPLAPTPLRPCVFEEPPVEPRSVSRVCERAGGGGPAWDEQRRELEHEQNMRLLALQESVWEGKRRAARQKEKAARAKKLYYRAKLQRIGAEVPASSSSDDSDH